jgi:hypothetical protein
VAQVKALTVQNPYAWAIATGRKPVENRTRLVSYRGDIAIHAGAAWYRGAETDPRVTQAVWVDVDPVLRGAPIDAAWWGLRWWRCVVAVAELHDCHVPESECCESEWADPDVGAHWMPRDVRRLDEHVPARGALGLWTLPGDVERAVCEQLPAPAAALW